MMPYIRDNNGRLPIFEDGRYRHLSAVETAAAEARERAEEEADAKRTAEWIAAGRPGNYIPHPHNCNRVSYGRSDPDRNVNWPQRTDGTTP